MSDLDRLDRYYHRRTVTPRTIEEALEALALPTDERSVASSEAFIGDVCNRILALESLALPGPRQEVTVTTRPPECRTGLAGRLLGEPCPDCGHLVAMHSLAHGCEVCNMRHELGLPARKAH